MRSNRDTVAESDISPFSKVTILFLASPDLFRPMVSGQLNPTEGAYLGGLLPVL